MKRNIQYGFTALILTALVISCKKNKDEDINDGDPEVNISVLSPMPGDTVQQGEKVSINGTIHASQKVHGYRITLVDDSTKAYYLNEIYHEHAPSYNFSENWTNNVDDTAYVTATIDVEIDHDGNMKSEKIKLVCLP